MMLLLLIVLVRLSRLTSNDQSRVLDRVSEIDQHADDASRTAARLSLSVYVMLGWVVLVTVAIAAVAVVTLRRRRPDNKRPLNVDVVVESERDWTQSLADVDQVSCSSSQVISVNE